MSILIVLYGQENEDDGKLRFPAAARCAKAAEVFRDLAPGTEVVILPTAAFGAHFNLSDHPHYRYLTQELIRLGIPIENILPGVNGSNTLQDSTEAWYRFKSGGYNKLVAVTSDYHAARVAFILGRLSANGDAEIEIVTADTPSDYTGEDRELEEQKLETLKREWVDVIPRNSKIGTERFAAIYENAEREFRHHNTLSFLMLAALIAVNGFAFLIVPGKSGLLLFFMLIGLAVIDFLLWSIRYRMAEAASSARRVLTRMEIEHRLPGFSSNWKPERVEWFRSPPWLWSLTELVIALAIALFVALAIVSFAEPNEPTMEVTQTPTRSAAANSNTSPTPMASANGNALDRWSNRVLGDEDNTNTNTNRRRRR